MSFQSGWMSMQVGVLRLIFAGSLALAVSASGARAELRFSVFPFMMSSSDLEVTSDQAGVTITDTIQSQWGFGGGGAVELKVTNDLGLELGAIYLERSVQDSVNNLTLTFPQLHLPFLFRMWIRDRYCIGLGGYYAAAFEPAQIQSADGQTTYSHYDNVPIGSGGFEKRSYGALAVVGVNFPIGEVASLLIEARYAYGLQDMVRSTAVDAKWRDLQAVLGFRFGSSKRR